VSWNPAVPPPPVAGAAAGIRLDDRAAGDGLALVLALVLVLVVLVLVVGRAVPLAEAVRVAEPLAAGENGVGVDEGEDPLQAETDAEASMAKLAQPTAVSLAPRPVRPGRWPGRPKAVPRKRSRP
jgi:hypothetical protein